MITSLFCLPILYLYFLTYWWWLSVVQNAILRFWNNLLQFSSRGFTLFQNALSILDMAFLVDISISFILNVVLLIATNRLISAQTSSIGLSWGWNGGNRKQTWPILSKYLSMWNRFVFLCAFESCSNSTLKTKFQLQILLTTL